MRLGDRRTFVAFGALAVILAGCGGTSPQGAAGAPATLKLMVGGLSKQIYLPNMLAQQLGYFKEQNLNVTLIDEGSGQGSETEVVAGNVNAGSGAYSHPVELNALGKNIETICQFGIAPGEAEMVDAKKAGSIQSVNPLKGNNPGATEPSSGHQKLTPSP